MALELLHEPLACAFVGFILGIGFGIYLASCCFGKPGAGQRRPIRQRPVARGELKMVLLVRTDLGMQKGHLVSSRNCGR